MSSTGAASMRSPVRLILILLAILALVFVTLGPLRSSGQNPSPTADDIESAEITTGP
jgi:hypothetical protein